MKKGIFITLYGVNNIGKSTQARKLVERLKAAGYDSVLLKYPIYDLAPSGPQLNSILRGESKQTVSEEELQTLFMENRRAFEPQLKKMLAEGKLVVAEDYTGTGIAWGTAKGLDQRWVEDLNRDLLREDLAILLRGKRHLNAKEEQHLHEQDDALVEKVDEILLRLSQKYGWQIVKAEGGIEEVGEDLWKVIHNFLTLPLKS